MNTNPAIYKYMKRRHLRSFLKDGLIRIGTLYDFRDVEKHGAEIGDVDEGTKTLTTDGYHFIDTANQNTIPDWYRECFESSFKVKDGGRLQIHAGKGVRLRLTVPDRYVFCASYEFDGGLIENGEYDACLKIINPMAFFLALSQKLKHRASWIGYGKCVYRPRIVLGDQDHGIEPSLIKEERYEYQKEIRAIWEARSETIEPIIIKAKKARFYCEVIRE
jgi:hypothetical protein